MADTSRDAVTPETMPPLRTLPRGVQVGGGLLLAVAIILGVALFNLDKSGAGMGARGAGGAITG